MTIEAATYEARKRAKKSGREQFIVWSDEAHDFRGQHYHPCDEFDLDTFYDGCRVLAVVEPDGSVEAA